MKQKLKETCLSCFYWTGKGGRGKAYKCYTKTCPARIRDEGAKPQKKKNKGKTTSL